MDYSYFDIYVYILSFIVGPSGRGVQNSRKFNGVVVTVFCAVRGTMSIELFYSMHF